ncbi:MAG TPA: DUF4136 domain-containing protein [Cyclobacteriaceae bacterium]|nr:DUF4136 domain-containing protein [Cyclobacteriaceae bacterium]
MKTTKYFLLLIVAGLAACSPSVHVDRDEAVDLSAFHTYKFVDIEDEHEGKPDPLYNSSLLDKAIHTEIAKELANRGFRESRKAPELLVAYHTYTEQKQEAVNSYPMMYNGWGWRYYPLGFGLAPYPYGYWSGYNQTYTYTEGTLIIDVINARTKTLVWRGSVSDAISDPGDLHKKGIQTVRQIFRKFPVRSNERQNDEPIVSNRNQNKK